MGWPLLSLRHMGRQSASLLSGDRTCRQHLRRLPLISFPRLIVKPPRAIVFNRESGFGVAIQRFETDGDAPGFFLPSAPAAQISA